MLSWCKVGVWCLGKVCCRGTPGRTHGKKTAAPGKKKHPLLSSIALHFAHVKSAQLALEAALGALRDLLVFVSSVPAQSGSPKVTRYLLLVVRALWFSWWVAGTTV